MNEMLISEHFAKYFRVCLADTPELKALAYSIRYQVYCQEFHYEQEENCPNGLETDPFDEQARHCLLIHRPTNIAAGCVRLVGSAADDASARLPFEFFCQHAIDRRIIDIEALARGSFGEFSRLAVLASFRRRKTDDKSPISLAESSDPSASDRINHPVISVSLFLAALALLEHSSFRYGFAMMEPRLARLLKRYGILFDKIGNVIDYHGFRGPFLMARENISAHFTPDIHYFYSLIQQQLFHDPTAAATPPLSARSSPAAAPAAVAASRQTGR